MADKTTDRYENRRRFQDAFEDTRRTRKLAITQALQSRCW